MIKNNQPLDESVTSLKARPLWRNRDYILLMGGQAISSLGGQASELAMPLLVLFLTNSPAQAGLIGALRLVPYLFLSLPGGVLVDRLDRKMVMIVCDTLRALALGSIPVAFALGLLTLPQLYVVSLVEGSLYVFFSLAQVSCLPEVVPEEQLATALGQDQAIEGTASLLGPSIGGVLFSIGQVVPFLVDAISYVVSVVSLAFIRTPFQQERSVVPRKLREEIVEGVSWVWHQPLVRYLALRASSVNFATSGAPLLVIVLAQQQRVSSASVGVILAAAGVGAIVGSLLAPLVQKYLSFSQTMIGVAWLYLIFWSLYLVALNPIILGLITVVVFVNRPITSVISLSYRHALVPEALRGRVSSVAQLLSWGSIPLSSIVTGLLLQQFGSTVTILFFSAFFLLLAAVTTLSPTVRNAPPLSELQAPEMLSDTEDLPLVKSIMGSAYSADEKLALFREEIIAHRALLQAEQVLARTIQEPAGIAFVLLYGPSGVGKSALLRKIAARIKGATSQARSKNATQIPLLTIGTRPPDGNVFDRAYYYRAALQQMGEPYDEQRLSGRSKVVPNTEYPELRTAMEAAMRRHGVRVVILDDAQHMVSSVGNKRNFQELLSWITSLSDATQTLYILAGTYDLLSSGPLNGQAARRSIALHLPRYQLQRQEDCLEFQTTLFTLLKKIPLKVDAEALVKYRWTYFYERSIGCIGVLKEWLLRAVYSALEEGHESLTLERLQEHALLVGQCEQMVLDAIEGERKFALLEGRRENLWRLLQGGNPGTSIPPLSQYGIVAEHFPGALPGSIRRQYSMDMPVIQAIPALATQSQSTGGLGSRSQNSGGFETQHQKTGERKKLLDYATPLPNTQPGLRTPSASDQTSRRLRRANLVEADGDQQSRYR